MDLTQVIPALLDGAAQELGMEKREFKLVIAGNPGQFDPKPIQQLMQDDNQIEWEFVHCSPLDSPEPRFEIRLKNDVPLIAPHSTQTSVASDVKGSGQLPMVNAQSLCTRSEITARALRSRMVCSMEG